MPSGEGELAALQQTPHDRQKAVALAEVLLARADTDDSFRQTLVNWWDQAAPVRANISNVTNTISGGTQYGPVLQGRDFSNLTFITNQAAAAPVAQAQLPAPVVGFTGREAELTQLAELLDPTGATGPVVVSAMAGLAGPRPASGSGSPTRHVPGRPRLQGKSK